MTRQEDIQWPLGDALSARDDFQDEFHRRRLNRSS